MTEFSEADAERIAQRGRDALLERLRPAFRETARQHADVLGLDDEQLEAMVQRAADRADGLQWRRALAAVATEELGITLGEALGHPAVIRAGEIAGAPSYEEALAALGLQPAGRAAAADRVADAEAAAPAAEHDGEADGDEFEAGPDATEAMEAYEHEDDHDDEHDDEHEAGFDAEEHDEYDEDHHEDVEVADHSAVAYPTEEHDDAPPETLRLGATHLGGIATLEPGEQNLELRLGNHGLDIARKPGRVLGRLRWREIRALEVPAARGLRRRRRQDRAHLVIRTQHGDASFEIPSITDEELRGSLQPLLERYARR